MTCSGSLAVNLLLYVDGYFHCLCCLSYSLLNMLLVFNLSSYCFMVMEIGERMTWL